MTKKCFKKLENTKTKTEGRCDNARNYIRRRQMCLRRTLNDVPHTINDCSQTRSRGGLRSLHTAVETSVNWLTLQEHVTWRRIT